MDRNLALAIVLSIIIIIGSQYFFQAFSPPPPQKPPATTEQTEKKVPPKATDPAQTKEPEAGQDRAEVPLTQPVPAAPTAADAAAPKPAQVTIDALKYEAVISSVGGRIVSFKLKDFKEELNGAEPVNLFPPDGPDTSGPSVIFTTREERFDDSGLPYQIEGGEAPIKLMDKDAKKSITFKAVTRNGLTIAKTFTFNADSYEIGFSVALTNNSNEPRNYLITFPWKKVFKQDDPNRFAWNSAEILLNDELKDYLFTDIKGEEEPSGQVQWAGLGSVYFFKALVFGKKPATKVTLFKPTKEGLAEIRVRYGALDINPGQTESTDLSLYLGPKERDALQQAGHGLSRALYFSNYKALDLMAEYLMTFLRFCNSGFSVVGARIPGTNNYGWDIILLTVVIKILFIPLTHWSMKSMKKMQDLQPQIQKIREKYKDNREELNKATLELFREHKVSPFGSCWPMFLQLPVFIALYQALSYAIELRHAPFLCVPSIFLCINDLSAPDPYYVTPILMGGTMVLQQWMTPSAGDPMQKKMMLLMPVVFTYLFLSFPSGLVLYWLVSNLLSIAQQLISNRMNI